MKKTTVVSIEHFQKGLTLFCFVFGFIWEKFSNVSSYCQVRLVLFIMAPDYQLLTKYQGVKEFHMLAHIGCYSKVMEL